MPNLWTPEAEDLKAVGFSGTLAGGAAKAIAHVTVSGSGGGNFDSMHRVLTYKEAEPHYLYDPVTDRLGQYFALDRSSRSLMTGNGPVSCNKAGSRVIQVEVCAWPGTTTGAPWKNSDGTLTPTTKGGFTSIWNAGPNFRAMMRDIAANGVPSTFPMGSTTPGCPRASWATYTTRPGWYGHCHVPYQDHWDPGLIDIAAFFAAAPLPSDPSQEIDMKMNDPVPGTEDLNGGKPLTVGQCFQRGAWAYAQVIDKGSIDTRLDASTAAIAAINAKLAAKLP